MIYIGGGGGWMLSYSYPMIDGGYTVLRVITKEKSVE